MIFILLGGYFVILLLAFHNCLQPKYIPMFLTNLSFPINRDLQTLILRTPCILLSAFMFKNSVHSPNCLANVMKVRGRGSSLLTQSFLNSVTVNKNTEESRLYFVGQTVLLGRSDSQTLILSQTLRDCEGISVTVQLLRNPRIKLKLSLYMP
jgi:hypothetical protein